jgi:hypothetical protein
MLDQFFSDKELIAATEAAEEYEQQRALTSHFNHSSSPPKYTSDGYLSPTPCPSVSIA